MPAKKNSKKTVNLPDWVIHEDPLMMEEPFFSSLESVALDLPLLHDAVRMQSRLDPWCRPSGAPENDSLTEKRRKKCEESSLNVEFEVWSENGESVA